MARCRTWPIHRPMQRTFPDPAIIPGTGRFPSSASCRPSNIASPMLAWESPSRSTAWPLPGSIPAPPRPLTSSTVITNAGRSKWSWMRSKPINACNNLCCVRGLLRGCEKQVYALLLAQYAVRALMHRAGCQAGVDPDRLSFTDAIFVLCETTRELAQVERSHQEPLRQEMYARLTAHLLPERHLRANQRAHKRLYRKYNRKPRNEPAVPPSDPMDQFRDSVVRLSNGGVCPSREGCCAATAAGPAETKGTAQLPYGSGETKGAASPLHTTPLPPLRGWARRKSKVVYL